MDKQQKGGIECRQGQLKKISTLSYRLRSNETFFGQQSESVSSEQAETGSHAEADKTYAPSRSWTPAGEGQIG